MEFYIIALFGCVGVIGYAYHMIKMQKEIEVLNDRMDAEMRRFEEE
tara:strand:- start:16115 stop:16252 length:138 start_codon:yes stop_codon:yes gene_type:complete